MPKRSPTDRFLDFLCSYGTPIATVGAGVVVGAAMSYAVNFWFYNLVDMPGWAVIAITGLFGLIGGWANRRPLGY